MHNSKALTTLPYLTVLQDDYKNYIAPMASGDAKVVDQAALLKSNFIVAMSREEISDFIVTQMQKTTNLPLNKDSPPI